MYLLDTDYMSLIQRGSTDGKMICQRLITTNSPLATTIITYEEQMRGWLDLIARATKFDTQVRGYQLIIEILAPLQPFKAKIGWLERR